MSADSYFIRMQESYALAPLDPFATHRTSWQVVRADDHAVVGRYAAHEAAASACSVLNAVAGVTDTAARLELYARLKSNA